MVSPGLAVIIKREVFQSWRNAASELSALSMSALLTRFTPSVPWTVTRIVACLDLGRSGLLGWGACWGVWVRVLVRVALRARKPFGIVGTLGSKS